MWEPLTAREERFRDRLMAPVVRLVPPWIHPTHLSLLRLGMVALAVVLYAAGAGSAVLQVTILMAAAATDSVDGALARSRGQATPLGGLVDAVSDWALAFWLGCLVLARGILGYGLIGGMIAPQLVIIGAGRRFSGRSLSLKAVRLKPTAPGRLQFVLVLGGFALLLLGDAAGKRGLLMAGYATLYAEVGVATITALGAVRAPAERGA